MLPVPYFQFSRILFLFHFNFFSFSVWDLFYFSGKSSNQPLLCLHISSKVSQEKDSAIVLNSKQPMFWFRKTHNLFSSSRNILERTALSVCLKRRQAQLNARNSKMNKSRCCLQIYICY